VSHEEALSLVPIYALGALDEDVEALEEHLDGCAVCGAQLATYLETTSRLGEAVTQAPLPPRLRERVLTSAMASRPRRPSFLRLMQPLSRFAMPAAAVLVVVAIGLSGGLAAQQRQLHAQQTALALDEQGLALLTSTETTNERLNPAPSLGSEPHGHWYHRPGVSTQVVVVEFMPAPPAGQSYYGWLQHRNSSWQPVGPIPLNSQGYGRSILLGSDGSDVVAVEVTRQTEASAAPLGEPLLRWAAS